MSTQILTRSGLGVVVILCNLSGTSAGEVHGYVRDIGKPGPGNGVSAVKVYLVTGKGNRASIGPTDASGQYKKPADPGDYDLEAVATGYTVVSIPTPPSIKVGDNPTPVKDIEVMRAMANNDYFHFSGAVVVERVRMAPKEKWAEAYRVMWGNIGGGALPPRSKYYFVEGIVKKDDGAKELFRPFAEYQNVSPENIGMAETVVGEVIRGKTDIPGRSAFMEKYQLPNEVVKDVFLFKYRTTGSAAEKDAFINRLSRPEEWKDISKEVIDLDKKMRKLGSEK